MSGEKSTTAEPSVAVAHWHIHAWGGAEYLVTKLAEAIGTDRIYTIGEPEPDDPNPYGDVEWIDVSTGPGARIKRRIGRPAEYALWEDVDWREYGDPDVLVTSGSTTRAVLTPDDTMHVNYCHSPPRWLYDLYHDRKGTLMGQLARPVLRYYRLRDSAVDPRVDQYLANSPIVARRIWKYYKRDADVLAPPLDIESYYEGDDDGFYLHLGRLDEEKGVPEVVRGFANTDRQLVLAGGEGDVSQETMDRIEQTGTLDYEGFVSEERKLELLATCRAVVFNGHNEDFGIVPIEANASGKAVLVPDEGFPAVFVEEGKNGYIHDGTPAGIRACLDRFESEGVGSAVQSYASQYSMDAFETELATQLEEWYDAFESRIEDDGT